SAASSLAVYLLCFYTMYSSAILSFFFHSSADHRDLHSFPTRRSSDLPRHGASGGRLADGPCDVGVGTCCAASPTAPHVPTPTSRSEEHTSELQSRGHLVCRLLLEKKKA